MDEKYLELVRNQLIAYDPTYKDISLQQFTKDMQEDSGYSRQVFNYLKESDNGKPDKVVVDIDFTQFSNRVKTNSDIDGAAGVSEQGVSGTTGVTGTISDETTPGITGFVGSGKVPVPLSDSLFMTHAPAIAHSGPWLPGRLCADWSLADRRVSAG